MKEIRTCIACRTKNKKNELIRIVSKDSIPMIDEHQNINSRGIYLCKSKICIDKCLKTLEKGKLNTKIDIDKESLKNVLKNVELELEE